MEERNRRNEIKMEILDAFFKFHRSTVELQDDLQNMYPFSQEEIAEYMIDHDYSPLSEGDGSVKWAIWRII